MQGHIRLHALGSATLLLPLATKRKTLERCSYIEYISLYSHGAFTNPFMVLSRPNSRPSREDFSFRRIWEVYKIHQNNLWYTYINLQLALSSALAVSAWIYARIWLFMLTRSWKRESGAFDGRVFTFFSRYSRENTLIFFASKCRKCKTVQLRSCGGKPLKKQKSLKWAFVCVFSRMQIYIAIWKSVNHPLSRSFHDGVCPFGFRQAFAQPSQAGF